jgi:hypothetical protein
MKYRTKPVEIEAVRFTGDVESLQGFSGSHRVWAVDEQDRTDDPDILAEFYDDRHSTWIGVKLGQWIIRGADGRLSLCDDKEFREKYERV